jgi:hypothetical protein
MAMGRLLHVGLALASMTQARRLRSGNTLTASVWRSRVEAIHGERRQGGGLSSGLIALPFQELHSPVPASSSVAIGAV